jgi:hypothetical protein
MCPSGSIDIVAVERGDDGAVLRIEVKTNNDIDKPGLPSCKYSLGKHFDHMAIVNRKREIQYHPNLPRRNNAL